MVSLIRTLTAECCAMKRFLVLCGISAILLGIVQTGNKKYLPEESNSTEWTLVVLPDTQYYAATYPEIFLAQTAWIAAHREEKNIIFVAQEGDIVDADESHQWQVAQQSFAKLDGIVPYSMAPGNHDYSRDRQTMFNDFFPPERFDAMKTFGGRFEEGRTDNNFHIFKAGGQAWLMLFLEFGPRNEVITWANNVVSEHPAHNIVVVTHAYLYSDNTRYNNKNQEWNPSSYDTFKDASDGEALWEKLISQHPNIRMVLSGHVLNDGLGRLTSIGAGGQKIHQILANYQMQELGGGGYLRLMEFHDNKISVRTFSPYLNDYKTDPDNNFEIEL